MYTYHAIALNVSIGNPISLCPISTAKPLPLKYPSCAPVSVMTDNNSVSQKLVESSRITWIPDCLPLFLVAFFEFFTLHLGHVLASVFNDSDDLVVAETNDTQRDYVFNQ